MNGSNNQLAVNKNYYWRHSFYLITFIYLLVVAGLALGAYRLPAIYQKIDQWRVTGIKQQVTEALALSTPEKRQAALTELVETRNIELVILSEQGFGFQTTATTDLATIKAHLNERSLSYQTSYAEKQADENYQIWLAVYQMEPQYFFEFVILILVISVLVLFALLSSLIFLMFKKLVEPIQRLKNNILKLKRYQLQEVSHNLNHSEYDALSRELSEFTDDLQGKMNHLGLNYTLLEQELQAEKEKLLYKDQSIGALVHNLKTPNSIVGLYLEQALAQADNEQQIESLEKAYAQNRLLLKEMKEIIQVTHQTEIRREKEQVDIVLIARELLQKLEDLLKTRQLLYDIVSPKSLLVYMEPIELKQLLSNIISNAIQYAPEGSLVELNIFAEADVLHIEAYNEVADQVSLDFERVFDLFYSQQGKKDGQGTGIGMYTIKNTVVRNQGTCTFEPYEDGVLLTILLPLGAESDA